MTNQVHDLMQLVAVRKELRYCIHAMSQRSTHAQDSHVETTAMETRIDYLKALTQTTTTLPTQSFYGGGSKTEQSARQANQIGMVCLSQGIDLETATALANEMVTKCGREAIERIVAAKTGRALQL